MMAGLLAAGHLLAPETIASAGPVALSGKTTTVELKQQRALSPGRQVFLLLKDIRAEVAPGAIFGIYLDLPANAEPRQAERHLVGYLNFFNVVGRSKPAARSFDITALLRELGARNALTSTTTVVLKANRQPSERAKATIGAIEIVETGM